MRISNTNYLSDDVHFGVPDIALVRVLYDKVFEGAVWMGEGVGFAACDDEFCDEDEHCCDG